MQVHHPHDVILNDNINTSPSRSSHHQHQVNRDTTRAPSWALRINDTFKIPLLRERTARHTHAGRVSALKRVWTTMSPQCWRSFVCLNSVAFEVLHGNGDDGGNGDGNDADGDVDGGEVEKERW